MSAAHRCGYAPDLTRIREGVASADLALPTAKTAGLNLAEFDEIVVQVGLTGAATGCVVEACFWEDGAGAAGAFVREATTQKLTVAAAPGSRKTMRVAHHGSVFFEITGIVGVGAVNVAIGGVPVFGQTGS